MSHIAGKDDLLMPNLIKFFMVPDNLNILLPLVRGESAISLRLIDWFVTNYIKYKNIKHKPNKNESQLLMYDDYKSQLNAYSKKKFDPFCRRQRIKFYFDKNKHNINTTVGQLNFFKWFIEKKYIHYIVKNLTQIENAMFVSENKTKINKKRRKKVYHTLKLTKLDNKEDTTRFIVSFD